MATARDSESSSGSDSDTSDDLDSSESADEEEGRKVPEACRYYNGKGCKNDKCTYLHVCKNVLVGNVCGPRCQLNHDIGGGAAPAKKATGQKLTDGKRYQWQLNDGTSWKNIKNDHVIEINYCLPSTKGINIYNTPYGVVRIDFTRMRVLKKDLKVRRLDDGQAKWMWYCKLSHKWKSYGNRDARGSGAPASREIEKCFQRNRKGSFNFSLGVETYEINFRGGDKEEEGGSPTTSFPVKEIRSRSSSSCRSFAESQFELTRGRALGDDSDIRQMKNHEMTKDI